MTSAVLERSVETSASRSVSRRDVLKSGATGAFAIGSAALLGACSTSSPARQAGAQRPKRGGILQAGLTGTNGSSDTLDADNALTAIDDARVIQLYDPLVTLVSVVGWNCNWRNRSSRTQMPLNGPSIFDRTLPSTTAKTSPSKTYSSRFKGFSIRRILSLPRRPWRRSTLRTRE